MLPFSKFRQLMQGTALCIIAAASFVSKANAQGAGSAVSFPATTANEHINLGTGLSSSLATSNFTIEMWVNFAALTSDEPVIANKDWNNGANVGWALTRSSKQSASSPYLSTPITANTLWFNIMPSGGTRRDWHITLPNLALVNKWNHIAIVVDRSNNISFYINGVPATIAGYTQNGTNSWAPITTAIGTDASRSVSGTNPIRVGQDGTGSYSPRFGGKVDEVRIWNTLRTAQELRDNMCQKLTGSETGLLAYYRLDEATGNTITNSAATGATYDAQIVNNAARISSAAPLGDASANLYAASFSGQSVSLNSPANGNLSIQNMGSSLKGMQVYRIDAAPATYGTIPNNGGNNVYYGVFPIDTGAAAATYDLQYNYGNFPAANTYEQGIDLYKRFSTDSAWAAAGASRNTSTKLLTLSGLSNRDEIIIGNFANPLVCTAPSALTATSITHNSASLGWTSGGSNRWNLEYAAGSFTPGSGTRVTNLNASSYALSTLIPNTSYAFYVQDTCAAIPGSSPWVGPYSFTTLSDYSSYGSGYAIRFPGTSANEHINLGTAMSTSIDTTDFTLETWVNFARFNDDETFISNKNWNNGANIGFALARSNKSGFPANTFWFNWQTTGGARRDWHVTIPGLALINNWNHVAVTVNRHGNIAFYINGVPATVVAYAQNGSNNFTTINMDISPDSGKSLKGTMAVRLGQDGTGTYGVKFNGWMDEVRIWNTVRTQTEIRDYMCRKLDPATAGLLSYYRVDEPSGNVAVNLANPGTYNGTLNNSPQRVISGAPIGDTSIYVYGNNLTALQLNSTQYGNLLIDSLSATYTALQLYRVDTVPNNTYDIANLGTTRRYFGIFPVDTAVASGNVNFVTTDAYYRLTYDYAGYPNAVANKANLHLYNRVQNNAPIWTDLGAQNQTAGNKIIASGQRKRKEVILADFVAAACTDVTLVNADSITNSFARIRWTSNGNSWYVQYGREGFALGSGTVDTIAGTPKDTISGLQGDTWYDVYVRNNCGTDSSKWVGPYTFRTADPCPAPSNVQVQYLGGDSVRVTWNMNGASFSTLQWGDQGFTFGNGIPVEGIASGVYVLTGLSNAQSYDIYIQDSCTGSGHSKWLGPVTFQANGPVVSVPSVSTNGNGLAVYPNPAQNYLAVDNKNDQPVTVRLLNIQGHVVYTSVLTAKNNRIDLGNMPNGVYILQCNSESGSGTFKIIIQKN